MVVNGILFRTRTGCPWRDLPGEYGHWKTVYNRHRRWSLDGTWQKILDRLRAGCDEAEGPGWTLSADSTVIRVHQYTAGARHALPAGRIPGSKTPSPLIKVRNRPSAARPELRAGARWPRQAG